MRSRTVAAALVILWGCSSTAKSPEPTTKSPCQSVDAETTVRNFVGIELSSGDASGCLNATDKPSPDALKPVNFQGALIGQIRQALPPPNASLPNDSLTFTIPFPPQPRCPGNGTGCPPDTQGGIFVSVAPDDVGTYGVVFVLFYSSA